MIHELAETSLILLVPPEIAVLSDDALQFIMSGRVAKLERKHINALNELQSRLEAAWAMQKRAITERPERCAEAG